MPKKIHSGQVGRQKLLDGALLAAKTIGATLGPGGRTVLIDKPYGAPRSTKDGVTVAREIDLLDKYENMGARMIRAAASKTVDQAGDGTTTSSVLAGALMTESMKFLMGGANATDLRRGMELAGARVCEHLASMSKEVSTSQEIAQIGTISANGDKEIGNMLADAMEKIGKAGVISVEENKTTETELEVVEGMQFDRGYISPYFVTRPDKMICELENPVILLLEKKPSELKQLVPILEQVNKQSRSILIIVDELEGEILTTLVLNKLQGSLKVVAVKAPAFGDRRKAALEDIAALTGGTVISEELGIKLEKVAGEMLGQARKVVVTKDNTTIIEGAGEKETIKGRIELIQTQIEDATSEYDKGHLRERVAKLSGGVAVIRVGGATEVEVRERKDRVEDAMHATRAAVEEGIVPGGGVALLHAAMAIEDLEGANDDQTLGIGIVRRALQAPLRTIAENAGKDGAVVVGKIMANPAVNFGWDAYRDEYKDMVDAGIIDPTKVVRTALESAISVASQLITTEAVISEIPEKKDQNQGQPMGDDWQ